MKRLRFFSFAPARMAEVIGNLRRNGRRQDTVYVLDLPAPRDIGLGRPSAAAGRLAVASILMATGLASRELVQAIVTAPLSKTSLKLAGFSWPGHTEMLADFTGTEDFRMMFVSPKFKVILVTIHQALKTVSASLSFAKIYGSIALGRQTLLAMSIKKPRIAVAGLNPHAGEGGLFGDEEKRFIEPAIRQARQKGWAVEGPFPPDTMFLPRNIKRYDLFVCLYHDQGLIPLKMTAFDRAVNVTVGLPFFRTSPDHGTAFDIAGRGVADPGSFLAAYRLAVELAGGR